MNRQNLTHLGTLYIIISLFLLPPLSASGLEHQWSQKFGDVSDQTSLAISTDQSGNVIITGSFAGSVDFGGSTLISAGGADIFLSAFGCPGDFDYDSDVDDWDLFLYVDTFSGSMTIEEFAASFGRLGCS